MDLFLQTELAFEKIAAGVDMPEDPNQWPQEVLQQLFKQAPFLSDFSPNVTMDKVDAEKGYGFGHVTITQKSEVQQQQGPGEASKAAGMREIRIPIVIKQTKMCPLDLLVTDDSSMMPLTESRLRQAIFRPQAFDVTSKTPGDQSLTGQLYPPHRQNYGMGGNASVSSVDMGKTSSVLEAILPTLNESHLADFRSTLLQDDVRLAYEKNAAATLDSLQRLLTHETVKVAEMETFVRPTVVQVVRLDEGYAVKMASHQFWNPQTVHLDRGEAIQQLGEKIVLAADVSGAATVAEGADAAPPPEEAAPDSDMQSMGPITEFGLHKVQTDDGQELVGYVIPNLLDIDGTPIPLALFTNGSQAALQADIMGVAVQAEAVELPTGDQPQGYGAFFSQGPEGIQATVPMDIQGSFQGPEAAEGEAPTQGGMQATTFDGRSVEVSQQPNIQAVTPMDGKLLIPEHWQWLPLDKAGEVSLVGGEDDAPKEASARRHYASVEIVSGGGEFSLRGYPVEKLASASREFLNVDDAMFLLAGLGV
ncbi:MAG: hypothetical protein V3S01_08375, partial [Dehalococcoidia bacterium]